MVLLVSIDGKVYFSIFNNYMLFDDRLCVYDDTTQYDL